MKAAKADLNLNAVVVATCLLLGCSKREPTAPTTSADSAVAEPVASALEKPSPKPESLSQEPVIYLGCGDVNGPGLVVQFDKTGKALGTVSLPAAPRGLAATKDGLVAALPNRQFAEVVHIGSGGNTRTLCQDAQSMPAPITIAAAPETGDLLVGDNRADVLLRLPAGSFDRPETLLHIEGDPRQLQNMSVALTKDGYALLGTSEPAGIYRVPLGTNAALGEPVLANQDGEVVADSSSERWAALLRNELKVFKGRREELAIPYPAWLEKWLGGAAFSPDGSLILALHRDRSRFEIVQADFEGRRFRPLFAWNKARVVSLAVGPKMAWPENTLPEDLTGLPEVEAVPTKATLALPASTPGAAAAPDSDLGKTFTDMRQLFDYFEAKGFIILGRFEHSEWPAKTVYTKEATNEISFLVRKSGAHTYQGYTGYRLKVVALEDAVGSETVVVLRSTKKLTEP